MTKNINKFEIFIRTVFLILSVLMLVYLISIATTSIKHNFDVGRGNLLGYRIVPGRGSSMEPTLNKNLTIMLVKDSDYVNYNDIKEGDLISFKAKNFSEPDEVGKRNITHRVIKLTDDGLITKGDGNDYIDFWLVQPEDLLGKVEYVVKGGRLVSVNKLNPEGIETPVGSGYQTLEQIVRNGSFSKMIISK